MNTIPASSTLPSLLKAYSLWRQGQAFQLKAINWQPDWSNQTEPWLVAGLLEWMHRFESWVFPPSMIHYLGNLRNEQGGMLFHESFLNHLQRWSPKVVLQCSPEGTCYQGDGPLFALEGPMMEIQMALDLLVKEVPPLCQLAGKLASFLPHLGNRPVVQWSNPAIPMEDGYWAPAYRSAGIHTISAWPGLGQLMNHANSWRYEWPVVSDDRQPFFNQPCWIPVERLKNHNQLPTAFGCFGTMTAIKTHGPLPESCMAVGIAPHLPLAAVQGIVELASPTLAI